MEAELREMWGPWGRSCGGSHVRDKAATPGHQDESSR